MPEADIPTAAAIAAEVAARYGVAVCPSIVKICPPRTFATTTPIWDGKDLIYPDHAARKDQHKKAMWAGAAQARASAVDPVIAARRDSVRRLHADGLPVRQIAEALAISYSISLADHRAARLAPNAFVTAALTQSAVRAARVAQLHGEGWRPARIAALLGLTEKHVRRLAFAHHGLTFARAVVKLAPPKAALPRVPAAIARQAVLRGFWAEGVPMADWAARCGVSVHTIRGDVAKMGLPWGSARGLRVNFGTCDSYNQMRLAEQAARRVEVLRLTRAGLMPSAIAKQLGCTPRTVAVDKRALGLMPARGALVPDVFSGRRAA